jgi:hypothetical protein
LLLGACAQSPVDWNATDACALVGKDRVAKALTAELVSAQLLQVTKGAENSAAFSTCYLTFANGTTVTVLTRLAPVPDVSERSLALARTMGGNMPTAEELTGLGAHAYWTAEAKTLQVFLDDRRYVSIAFKGTISADAAKIGAISVAKLF